MHELEKDILEIKSRVHQFLNGLKMMVKLQAL